MDRTALNQLSKDDLIALLLAQEARHKADMTLLQARIADRVGVSQASVYFWENGLVRPRVGNLRTLCKVLRLPARAILEATGA